MLYLLGGLALVAALSGLFGAWEHKGKIAAEAQLGECQAKVEQQNQAISATKAEGDRRVAEAQKGVAKAARITQAARSEAQRLRDAAAAKTAPSACPAAEAVSQIRAGLK